MSPDWHRSNTFGSEVFLEGPDFIILFLFSTVRDLSPRNDYSARGQPLFKWSAGVSRCTPKRKQYFFCFFFSVSVFFYQKERDIYAPPLSHKSIMFLHLQYKEKLP